jgi:hypothetical protein
MGRFLALASALLISTAAPAFAAGGTSGVITGHVVDAGGQAVAKADVTLRSPSGRYSAHTDDRGRFIIVNVPVDSYTLDVHKDGFRDRSLADVELIGDQTADVGNIGLTR